jgi:hypothetical protein
VYPHLDKYPSAGLLAYHHCPNWSARITHITCSILDNIADEDKLLLRILLCFLLCICLLLAVYSFVFAV